MANYLLALCVAVGAVLYLLATSQLPQGGVGDPLGAKAFPYLIGTGLLLSAVVMAAEARRQRTGAVIQPPSLVPPPSTALDASVEPRAWRLLVGMAAWTLVYYVAFEPAGYVLATTIYLMGLLSFLNRGRWALNIGVTLGFTVVSYVIFAKLLGVALPSGVLGI